MSNCNRRDVGSNREGNGGRAEADTAPDDGEKSEGRDEFTEELGAASPNVLRYLEDWLREHEMSSPYAEHCAYGQRRREEAARCAASNAHHRRQRLQQQYAQ